VRQAPLQFGSLLVSVMHRRLINSLPDSATYLVDDLIEVAADRWPLIRSNESGVGVRCAVSWRIIRKVLQQYAYRLVKIACEFMGNPVSLVSSFLLEHNVFELLTLPKVTRQRA